MKKVLKTKRVLTLLLALALLVSMLAGCAGTPETPDDPVKEPEAGNTEEAVVDNPEKKDSWLCDEKTTLTVLTYDAVNNSYKAPSNDLPFWQWLEDYTNVHIEWEISPFSGYPEVISTKLASGGDLADIVMVDSVNNANNAGKNGLLVDFSGYWDTCFPKTQKYFEEDGTNYRALLSNEDGSMYTLVGTRAPVEGHIVIMYNAEWMEKLNAEIPTTLDDFTALLRQMQAAGDLNGNGLDDEIVLTSSELNHMNGVMGNIFGLEQYEGWEAFVADENGVVTPEYTSENMKNLLAYENMLYEEGLLDPEICTNTADVLSEKVAADKVGVFVYYSAFAITYGSLTPAGIEDPMGEHFLLGQPLASEYNDNSPYFVRMEKASNCPTSVSASCENPELAMRWLDTLLSDPEVLRVRTCGFEGEDWEYDENGEFKLIYPEDGSSWSIKEKGCGQIALCYIQTAEQLLNSKLQYEWYIEAYDDLRANATWVSPSIPKVNCFTDVEQEKIDYCKTDVESYWKEMRDKFIKGEASLEEDWDTYVSTMDQLGLDIYTEVWQSVYDRTK